jgi:hypothetical protein
VLVGSTFACRSARLKPLNGHLSRHDQDRTRGIVYRLEIDGIPSREPGSGQDLLWEGHLTVCGDPMRTVRWMHAVQRLQNLVVLW